MYIKLKKKKTAKPINDMMMITFQKRMGSNHLGHLRAAFDPDNALLPR